jgi:hypothetical protein
VFRFALGSHYDINSNHVLGDIVKDFAISFVYSMMIGAVFVSVRKKNAQ